MKFTGQIKIKKSREEVISLFFNARYNKEYQDGFEKKELIEGVENRIGAKSKIYYQYGKRNMVLTETVSKNLLPDVFEAFYHHKHMDNTVKYSFTEAGQNETEFHYEYEYTRIDWIMPRLMAILFPGMYKKQGDKWMRQFKQFAERY